MTTTQAPNRKAASRKFGYLVAGLVNGVLLYAVNDWPGWRAVPFLTEEAALVIGLVNASLIASVVANIVYLVIDWPWLPGLGNVITSTIGLMALVRILQVFPFNFGTSTIDWSLITTVVLVFSIIGSAIGIVVGLVTVLKGVLARPDHSATERD